jgi:putative tricarboxylic transport membrane protein
MLLGDYGADVLKIEHLPNAEQQMRRALQLSGGQLSGLVNSPFSIVVYTIIVALLVVPLLRRRRR